MTAFSLVMLHNLLPHEHQREAIADPHICGGLHQPVNTMFIPLLSLDLGLEHLEHYAPPEVDLLAFDAFLLVLAVAVATNLQPVSDPAPAGSLAESPPRLSYQPTIDQPHFRGPPQGTCV